MRHALDYFFALFITVMLHGGLALGLEKAIGRGREGPGQVIQEKRTNLTVYLVESESSRTPVLEPEAIERKDEPVPPNRVILEKQADSTDQEMAPDKQDSGAVNTAETNAPAGISADFNPGLISFSESFSEPQLLIPLRPAYPYGARLRGEKGEAFIRAWIKPDGELDRAELVNSSGFPALDRAAIEAVKAARFSAARRGGEPVYGELTIKVRFRFSN